MQNGILELQHISKSFGGLKAVDDLSFKVAPGHIKALIGPNGAGKTTAFNLISGLLAPNQGDKYFKGYSINGLMTHQVAALGIARTFQHVHLFDNMSALQNVMVGRHIRSKGEFLLSGLGLPAMRRQEKQIVQAARAALDLVGLSGKATETAGVMPYGEQKLLEVARAMTMEPELLLLDEPAAGLNEKETEDIAAIIQRIRSMGVTILLVEHDMGLVMDISDEIMVLNYGQKIAEGTPREIQEDPMVIEAYLGEEISD